jgi:2-dehydropantoate 2-reductase
MEKKIAVLGAGANGGVVAADLAAAGHDVVIIDQWPEHVEKIRERGIRVELGDQSRVQPIQAYHLCDVATFTRSFDIVLLLTKAYDTRWASAFIEPYLAADGLLVGMQNGMTATTIADVVGEHRTIGCVVELASMMFHPGVVERQSDPSRTRFALGPLGDGYPDRSGELAALLRCVGNVDIVADVQSAKWMKLVLSATALATSAIPGLPLVEAARDEQLRDIMLRTGREALDIGLALGYRIVPILGLPADQMTNLDTIAERLLDALCAGPVRPRTKTMVLQDWLKGRRSETSDINGLVAREAAALGLRAPANTAVMEIAADIEEHDLQPGDVALARLKARAPSS